jgi:shikimate dehydrogenase
VTHSLSPVLHGAAYRELGLADWTFERIEADAAALRGLVAGLAADWAGLAVTMPGKRAALALADERTPRAVAVGAANTLVPLGDGRWRADCTDVAGVTGALTAAGGYRQAPDATGLVLGAGGTAAAALAALAELDVRDVVLVVREPARAADAMATAARVGIAVDVRRWADVDLRTLASNSGVVVSTVPAVVADPHADELASAGCLLDVIYHPWPTPLADAVARQGGKLATGLDMLLHQAFGQVEQFTGKPAPRAAMRDALREATGGTLALPLD